MSTLREDMEKTARLAVQYLEGITGGDDYYWTNLEWLSACLGCKVEDISTDGSSFQSSI